jgi:tRNA (guanine-N7-)-methyltransferase
VNATSVPPKDLSNSHIRTFHARHGRLSDRRKYLADQVIPQLDVVNLGRPVDLRLHLNRDYIVIDFGCGMGDHTRTMSEAHPDWGILAMDVHTPGVCDVADIAVANGLGNISVHLGDGTDILRDHLADSSISEVHVLFPDPWPKARHNKRRVLQTSFFEMVSRVLVPGGHLHMVTDDDNYAEHVQEVIVESPQFQRVDTGFVVPDTSYHRRAIRLGHTIHTFSAQLK